MAIEKEKFFEIIDKVGRSEGLNGDNLLQKIKDELHKKDYAEYDKFKRNFSKEHQFSIKISDKIEDWTLLHLAVACNNLLTVELLLKKKVSVNARVKDGSNDGPTALDIATLNGNQEIIQLLRKANPQLEKNKDKTPRDIITKENEIPEDLVVKGNNATAALESSNKQTSFNSTDESSDSTVDEQRQSVKDMIKNFELPKRRNTTCSGKQTSISLNESGNSDDSGICTESEDGEDIDAKNEESKSHVTEYQSKLEALEKQNQKENQSLKQKVQDLGNENAKLKGELEKTKKNEVPLEKAQKELTELRSYVTGHETKLEVLEKLNKENESLKQEIKNLKNENTTLKGELGKTKTNEVSLEKVGKRQFSPKVAYASLAAMLAVGAALSIASGLSALLIVAASVVSALIAGGITYTISKPIAPDTELKEVKVQHNGVCKI